MDFYLTNLKTNERIHFPMNPEKVILTTGVITQDYTIMDLGEVRFPKGNKLDVVSWESKLPGRRRRKMSYVKDWKDPAYLYKMLKRYKQTGEKLRLLITGTPINLDVFIEIFDCTFAGGMEDTDYSITLTQWEDLMVYTVKESGINKKSAAQPEVGQTRPESPKPKTYTVQSGDSLWKIAQMYLGSGARYPEIYNINKPPLGSDPNLIYPGQVITIP